MVDLLKDNSPFHAVENSLCDKLRVLIFFKNTMLFQIKLYGKKPTINVD